MAENQTVLDAFLQPLSVDIDRLQRLAHQFATTYRYLALNSNDQFLPTPITTLPSGQERGRFLAIDLGGTNLRVGFIELLGDIADSESRDVVTSIPNGVPTSRDKTNSFDQPRIRRTFEKAWPIGEHLKMDKAEDLFAWIGDCIAEVVSDSVRASRREESEDEVIPEELLMGVTFSFPMIQHSLSEATLMPMGKGFAITSNLNLGKLLLAGYERHITSSSNGVSPDAHLDKPAKRRKIERLPRLKIAAITNDTVATLASLAYTVKSRPNSRVAMGLIVGTGTNATIPMKLADLHPSKQSQLRLSQAGDLKDVEIVVNTEWTINGTAPPLKKLGFITKWDKVLDEASEAPGFQPFEYMTAGRYLGELARLITLDFITGKLGAQEGDLPVALRRRNALTTTFLATVVAPSGSSVLLLPQLRKLLPAPEHSDWQWGTEEAEVLLKVARLVQKRSAGLIAAAIIGLLGCTGELELNDEHSPDSSVPNGTISHVTDNELSPQGDIEDLVVAFTGGTISRYPEFLRTCQGFIDELLSKEANRGASENNRNRTKSVVLKEAVDGGIIGAGVLAGTACA
ncbi:hypothetical protein GP486_000265 [Trichoglossum hirsutum]|uniref:Phosphotransferase n=1 Tax=Trichoglossum hirsutum TaxID=265104 RepID=A0A9P8LJ92_9PEZI|nr:hypothetical protein GP486_000265 [Trichoglossum hirsutum]